ncbi:endonuclease/exonuclease/phosphatase family protein [Streptomyces cavernae]|uniref:endonuclease/exonuclease/phosphatase family protein n=1 Tax=Streptomyces cavernae TaxID=2259034 RepID=UPI000FEBF784|nr:endonuclease/exonuclease/phosphatase family protein [Streptomyces cavernae]
MSDDDTPSGTEAADRKRTVTTAGRDEADSARRCAGLFRREGRQREVKGRTAWTRGRVTGVCALLVALVLLFPSVVPNAVWNLGSLVENFLPWLGVTIAPLLALAVLRRSAIALLALLTAVVVWAVQYGPSLLPHDSAASQHDLTVVQHNASDENANPSDTARTISAAGPDLIALEELTEPALSAYEDAFTTRYPHHAVVGTVGLWSRYPLVDTVAADIKPKTVEGDWSRGLRATVRIAPRRDIAVYVAHLPSVRIRPANGFDTRWRDESAALLGEHIAADTTGTVILMGDLNGTPRDRGLTPLTSQLLSPDEAFEFSWPTAFPVARIDQVLGRGATVTDLWTLPATGSDHLPLAAHIKLTH